ncbi:MAG: DUF370 domain-containing protein [Clostridia bacterium]|nr:DUF370 domain-containing protein [Clostridia bacterium]
MKLINIGFGNMLLDERIVALVQPDSAPAKRIVSEAKDSGRIIDCTGGRRTRSVIVTDSDHVILSALISDKIAERINGIENDDNGGNGDG